MYVGGKNVYIDEIPVEKAMVFVTKNIRTDAVPADCYYSCTYGEAIIGIIAEVRRTFFILEVKHFYVLPEFRGTGIGTALLRYFCKEYNNVFLTSVRLDNLAALNLFLKNGFKIQKYIGSDHSPCRLYILLRESSVTTL
jgi:ribosomal protein S18 acetylase RimI-like enzyme